MYMNFRMRQNGLKIITLGTLCPEPVTSILLNLSREDFQLLSRGEKKSPGQQGVPTEMDTECTLFDADVGHDAQVTTFLDHLLHMNNKICQNTH